MGGAPKGRQVSAPVGGRVQSRPVSSFYRGASNPVITREDTRPGLSVTSSRMV